MLKIGSSIIIIIIGLSKSVGPKSDAAIAGIRVLFLFSSGRVQADI